LGVSGARRLETLVGRLVATIENFYRGVPRAYADYLQALREAAGPGAEVRPEVLFRKTRRSSFPFGEVYSYAQSDYVRAEDVAILVRHTGWRVDTGDTKVLILTSYRVDVLSPGHQPATPNSSATPACNNSAAQTHNNNTSKLLCGNNNNKYREKE
jgi:hypothetical protein